MPELMKIAQHPRRASCLTPSSGEPRPEDAVGKKVNVLLRIVPSGASAGRRAHVLLAGLDPLEDLVGAQAALPAAAAAKASAGAAAGASPAGPAGSHSGADSLSVLIDDHVQPPVRTCTPPLGESPLAESPPSRPARSWRRSLRSPGPRWCGGRSPLPAFALLHSHPPGARRHVHRGLSGKAVGVARGVGLREAAEDARSFRPKRSRGAEIRVRETRTVGLRRSGV